MDKLDLSPEMVYDAMKGIFPKQNDYFKTDYSEEFQELKEFNIHSLEYFKSLMKKHKNRILEIDAQSIDEQHLKWYREDSSLNNLDEMIKKGFWFAFPAIIRIALELEFGEEYIRYADQRDGL